MCTEKELTTLEKLGDDGEQSRRRDGTNRRRYRREKGGGEGTEADQGKAGPGGDLDSAR